jgi:peroxiredoxin Q/BCP
LWLGLFQSLGGNKMAIKVGNKIPKFSIKDYNGIKLEPDDLLGSSFVLYFYPKDNTPGCTAEACSFRDNMEMFEELEITVIGVSPDSAESHIWFMQKYELNFILLCDENMDLARKFGAIQEKEIDGQKKISVLRSTYMVDPTGNVRWMEQPVNVEGHTERVIEAAKQL